MITKVKKDRPQFEFCFELKTLSQVKDDWKSE